MSRKHSASRVGLLALLAQMFRPATRAANERSFQEAPAGRAVGVISDYGVAPSFPGLR
jgi:hypothetical protein